MFNFFKKKKEDLHIKYFSEKYKHDIVDTLNTKKV